MAYYENLRSEGFAKRMKFIRDRYYTKDNHRKYTGELSDGQHLMYELLDDLEQFTAYGHRVDRFRLGDKKDYIRSKRSAYRKARREKGKKEPNINMGIVSGAQEAIWGAEWEHEARKTEYRAMVGTVDFLETVEDIVKKYKQRLWDAPTFKKPASVAQLAEESCGIPEIDRVNQTLLASFEKFFQKDLKAFTEKKSKEVEQDIDGLRGKSLYKYKASKMRIGDNRFVGEEGKSMTFASLFSDLRYIAKQANYSLVKEKEKVSLATQRSYADKLSSLNFAVGDMETTHKQVTEEKLKTILPIRDSERLDRLGADMHSKIAAIQTHYKQIKGKYRHLDRDVKVIDALNREIALLDDAISTLISNGSRTFRNTINLLTRVKEHYAKELVKYNDLMKSLDLLFANAATMQSEFAMLSQPYHEILGERNPQR